MERPELEVAGRFPPEVASYVDLAVGIPTRNKNDADARAFIKFITSADGRAIWSKTGLEPL